MDAERERREKRHRKPMRRALDTQIELIKDDIRQTGNFDKIHSEPLEQAVDSTTLDIGEHFAKISIAAAKEKFGERDRDEGAIERAREIIEAYSRNEVVRRVSMYDNHLRRIVGGIISDVRTKYFRQDVLKTFESAEIAEILSLIDRWWTDNAKVRTIGIVSDTAVNGMNLGMNSGFQGMDREVMKIWMATLDGKTRDSHAIADSQPRLMDEAFDLEGGQLMMPGDTSRGVDMAEIYNCRCGISYEALETI